MKSKNAVLKELQDAVIIGDEDKWRSISPYNHCLWKDLHMKSGLFSVGNRVAIPHILRNAVTEMLHATHPGGFEKFRLLQYSWWPYIHREIIKRSLKCQQYTKKFKKLKLLYQHLNVNNISIA